MKHCPHCGKDINEPKQTSPEGLLVHIKSRIHQNELENKRRKKEGHERYEGEEELAAAQTQTWKAWAIWVERQLINNQ